MKHLDLELASLESAGPRPLEALWARRNANRSSLSSQALLDERAMLHHIRVGHWQ